MNWETVTLAIITGLPPTILAAATLVQTIKTHKSVNGRMSELLEVTKEAAGDKATLAEKVAQSAREEKIETKNAP